MGGRVNFTCVCVSVFLVFVGGTDGRAFFGRRPFDELLAEIVATAGE